MSTNRIFSALEVAAVLSLSILLGACMNRDVTRYTGTLSGGDVALKCTVSVNPAPVNVTVDASGNLVGTNPTVTIGVSITQAARISAVQVSQPANLTLQAFAVPSPLQNQFSLTATPVAALDNSVAFTVNNAAGETTYCTALVTYNKTTSSAPAGYLKYPVSGDFNGNGTFDQAGMDAATGVWWVTLGGVVSAAQNWGSWSAATNWLNVTGIDINKDGKTDIVGRDPSSNAWWAAVSNGSVFTNLYLGSFTGSTTWTNIRFALNPAGIMCVYGTDGNGVDYYLPLNGTAGNPGTMQPIGAALQIGLAAGYGMPTGPVLNVMYGATAYVSWTATSATGCIVFLGTASSPQVIGAGNSGSYYAITNVKQNTVVSLGCNGAGGVPAPLATAQIIVGNAPAPALTLSASALAATGSRVAVSWSATNVNQGSCTLTQNGSSIALTGSPVQSNPISSTANLVLQCVAPAPYGIVQKTATIGLNAVLNASPMSFQYGSVIFGTTGPAQQLTLTAKNSALTVKDIEGTKYGLMIGVSSCGLAPFEIPLGATCKVPISFSPPSVGPQNGAVSIRYQTKDVPSSQTTITIPTTGTGLAPCYNKSCG